MKQILIISFWNPTPEEPGKGIFIHEQVDMVCKDRNDVVFLEVNILASKTSMLSVNIWEMDYYTNKKIVISIYSLFWKALFLSPALIFLFVKRILNKKFPWVNPALVHSNVIYPCGIVGYRLAQKYNSQHIISEHWSKSDKILKHPLFGSAALKVYRNSKAILCVSTFLANKIKAHVNTSNIIIVPNIVDSKTFAFQPKCTERDTSLHFTCVATWKLPKRLDLIIQSVIAFSAQTKQRIILNVVGNGRQTQDFLDVQLPDNLIINWLGFIKKNEIAQLLTRTDIFMHASEIETFSIVTLEALSTGTPVLASNVGALPELINKNNGELVENTINDWIRGLSEITNKDFDHKSIAAEIANKYSPETIVQRIKNIYQDCLDSM